MPNKTFFHDENILKCKERLRQILEALIDEEGFSSIINVDENVMNDCFKHALVTVKFYGIENGDVSHYKEISHISYWISKLKPVSLESPQRLGERLREYGIDVLSQLAGESRLKISQTSADSDFPINEYLAFSFASATIKGCQLEEIKRLEAPEQRALYRELQETASKRVRVMQKSIMNSMRYHNYSARGFATTVEGMMRLGAI